MASAQTTVSTVDRRSDQRYPVNIHLEYKLVLSNRMEVTGLGRSVNMSATGILFESSNSLPNGHTIELIIDWPSRPNRVIKLHAVGRTVRTQGNYTAVIVQQHKFRTARSQ
ncbi:MAG: PilZ domain-containing protein [Acidobacteriia bacterium]|nr:PilZ domain-containing protein [Terriglobia bacterium]